MGGWRGPLSPGQSYKSMGLKRPGVQPTTSKEPTDQPSSPANDTLVKRGRGRPPKIKNANNEIIVKSKAISELGSKGENDIEGHSKSQDAAPSLQAAPRETRSTTKATESAVSTEPATNPKPIKRGRGRPRKVAAAPSGNSSSVPVNSQVIVPSSSNTHESDTVRPRTRQLVAPAPTKIAPAANDTVKRGRGRPRKQVLQGTSTNHPPTHIVTRKLTQVCSSRSSLRSIRRSIRQDGANTGSPQERHSPPGPASEEACQSGSEEARRGRRDPSPGRGAQVSQAGARGKVGF